MGMSGGGGGSQTSETKYMPEDIQLRRLGIDYAHQAGGLGGRFSGPSPAASLDPWTNQVRNEYMGQLQGNLPMRGQEWQGMAQNAAMYNPMANATAMTPQARGYNSPDIGAIMGLTQGLQGDPFATMPTAMGGGFNFMNPQQAFQGSQAFNSDAMIQAAQNNLQRIVAPTIANNLVAQGSNPMSGAYAEAIANAGAGMALPITQQISQQQYGATMPQIQGFSNAQLQQQGAQQGLQGQGYGAGLQGMLNQQGAMNQILGQGAQGVIQGNLNQQGAQNALLGQGFGGQLQGGLQQQQNVFNQAMQTPAALNQLLQGQQANFGQQLNLANLDQAQQQQEFLRQQALWQQVASGLYGGGGMSPISQTTTTQGGGGGFGGAMTGALGAGATGALIGSPFGPLGAGIGGGAGLVLGALGGGFCWIADALYGDDSEEARIARAWVTSGWQGEDADEFREWYQMHGLEVAHALRYDEDFAGQHEDTYRKLFNDFVEKGREYLAV